MEHRIREAGPDDLPHLLRHRRAMFEEMGYKDPAVLARVDDVSAEYFRKALQDGSYKGWLAETANGQVVAGGGLVLAPWPGFPGESLVQRAWILNMYTEPCARRQGLAKRLVQVMVEWCRTKGFNSVSLHASSAGRPLYESAGFQPTNEMRLKLQ